MLSCRSASRQAPRSQNSRVFLLFSRFYPFSNGQGLWCAQWLAWYSLALQLLCWQAASPGTGITVTPPTLPGPDTLLHQPLCPSAHSPFHVGASPHIWQGGFLFFSSGRN